MGAPSSKLVTDFMSSLLFFAHLEQNCLEAVVLAALRSLRTVNIGPELMEKVQQLSELANTGGWAEDGRRWQKMAEDGRSQFQIWYDIESTTRY